MQRLFLTLLVLSSSFLLPAHAQNTSRHPVYDDADRLAVLITYTYDSTGIVETRQLQGFDREGRLTHTELYTADEQLLFTEVIRYDCHGNRSSCIQTHHNDDGTTQRDKYRYRYRRLPNNTWRLHSIHLNGNRIYLDQ